jgi:hypothetical protein
MSVNKSVYNGDPEVALSDIAALSKKMMGCFDRQEELRLEVVKLPHDSVKRVKKIKAMQLEDERCEALVVVEERMYKLFQTIPQGGKRLEQAEQCFLKGDFEGMDAALPEKKITSDIYRLNKRAENYLDMNWREVPILLREKSYELLLKGLLYCTHVEDPNVSKKVWRAFTKALNASHNAHTLFIFGWYYQMCLAYEKSREFLNLSISDEWMDKDLTEESRLFLLGECYAELSYVDNQEHDYQASIRNMQQALKYYSQLQEKNPTAYSSAVADALFSLADNHAALKAHAVAIVECEEALRIRRRLAVHQPQLQLEQVAKILMLKSAMHASKKEYREALQCGEEAIAIERKYLEFDRVGYRNRFAETLSNVSIFYSFTREVERSLQLQIEAVALFRELVEAYTPQSFQSELGEELCQCGEYHHRLKQTEDAYRCMEEGIERYFQAIAHQISHRWLERMDLWLGSLREWYVADEEYDKAIALYQRWVDALRSLEVEYPGKFLEFLRKGITFLAFSYYDKKDYEPFVPLYSEAIAIARQRYSKEDRESVFVLGFLLAKLGEYYTEIAPDREKALEHSLEASKILNPLRELDSRAEKAYQIARKSTRSWKR